jgi:hypothetical protein
LMFSGVMASLGSGSVAGGIERTEPVFPPRRERENCREGLSPFDVDRWSTCSSTLERRVPRGGAPADGSRIDVREPLGERIGVVGRPEEEVRNDEWR